MKAPETWLVVADGARAKILRVDRAVRRFELVGEMSSSEARRKPSELMTDRQGRAMDAGGVGQRSAMEPPTDPQRHEKERFARQLAETLEDALNARKFEKLVLVAAPQALGDLRATLDGRVKERIQEEIAKDLTRENAGELAEHLGELFWH
ncbi:host attachment protein [Geminicoccaceae bacterium 1502E]|nr:host attachment protein [Geminicoccaceae bacterium 1502E]